MRTAISSFIEETVSLHTPSSVDHSQNNNNHNISNENSKLTPPPMRKRGRPFKKDTGFVGANKSNTFLESLFQRTGGLSSSSAVTSSTMIMKPDSTAIASAVAKSTSIPIPTPSSLLMAFPSSTPVISLSTSSNKATSATMTNTAKIKNVIVNSESSLRAAAEAHYNNMNPLFAETEKLEMPFVVNPDEHHGEECGPNERIIQVARYGRIYKRKAPMSGHKRIIVSGPPGTRYCLMCEAHLPLSAFFSHIKRNVCKKHHGQRVRQSEIKRYGKIYSGSSSYEMWVAFWTVKDMLGYDFVNYDHADMHSLVVHAGIPLPMRPRVLPIDPSLPLRPRNVAIVTAKTFDLIMKTYKHLCSRAIYIAQVQRCNLIPRDMDVGWPENPRIDPEYRRVDIDVSSIIADEMQQPYEGPDSLLLEQ